MANQDITTTLYNGKYKVVFRNGNHRYSVNGKAQKGVTTVMGAVLAKPGLMLWPLNMAMKHLAGLDRMITLADLDEAKLAHVRKRDSGAGTGTIVHELVESYLNGEISPEVTSGLQGEVLAAYSGFTGWFQKELPVLVAVEQVVYSPTLGFTGTFDFILEIDGKNYLCDLKTTNASMGAPNGIYADYFIQLGAYLYAYEEQRQYELAHGGTGLVEIDDVMVVSCKKDGKVHTLTSREVGLAPAVCMKMWESTLFLHDSLLSTKTRIGGIR